MMGDYIVQASSGYGGPTTVGTFHPGSRNPTAPVSARSLDPHVSPSQQDTYLDCRAGWGWSRLYKAEPTEFSAFGDRAHLVGEAWLRDGIPPDPDTPEGACILAGLDRLPMPRTCAVELRFDFASNGTEFLDYVETGTLYRDQAIPLDGSTGWVHYTGRIDFLYGYDPGRIIVVGDHKTTGDLTYAKSEEVLLADPQRIDYSAYAAWRYGVEYVAAHWQYYRRKPPKSETRLVVERADVTLQRFRDLHERVSLPIVRSAGIHPRDLPKDGIAKGLCDRWYGKPCPYRGECLSGVSAIARAAAILRNTETTMTAQGNLLAHLQGQAQGQPPQQPAPQQGPGPLPPDMQAMLDAPHTDPATKAAIRNHYGIAEQPAQAPAFQPPAPSFAPPQAPPQQAPQTFAPPQAPPAPQMPASWAPPQAPPVAPQAAPFPAPQGQGPAGPAAPKKAAKPTIKLDRQMFLALQSFIPGRSVQEAQAWADAVGL